MSEPTPKNKPINLVVGVLSAIVGWAFAKYAGPSLWVPGFASVILFFLLTKTPLGPKYFTGTVVVTGGHIIWFIAAGILLKNFSVVGPDIALLTVGLIWLVSLPGLPPVLVLGLIQLASLAYNVAQISNAPVGSDPHRALSVHVLFRTLSIAALIVGYRFFQKSKSDSSATTSPEAPPAA